MSQGLLSTIVATGLSFSSLRTLNPRIGPGALMCKNEFLGRGLFQTLAFSSIVDIENDLIFSISYVEKILKRLFRKLNLVINNDFLITITIVVFLFAFESPIKGSNTA